MTETEKRERDELSDNEQQSNQDLKGWQVVNEMKDWLREKIHKSNYFSPEYSIALVMYNKLNEIERRIK